MKKSGVKKVNPMTRISIEELNGLKSRIESAEDILAKIYRASSGMSCLSPAMEAGRHLERYNYFGDK